MNGTTIYITDWIGEVLHALFLSKLFLFESNQFILCCTILFFSCQNRRLTLCIRLLNLFGVLIHILFFWLIYLILNGFWVLFSRNFLVIAKTLQNFWHIINDMIKWLFYSAGSTNCFNIDFYRRLVWICICLRAGLSCLVLLILFLIIHILIYILAYMAIHFLIDFIWFSSLVSSYRWCTKCCESTVGAWLLFDGDIIIFIARDKNTGTFSCNAVILLVIQLFIINS